MNTNKIEKCAEYKALLVFSKHAVVDLLFIYFVSSEKVNIIKKKKTVRIENELITAKTHRWFREKYTYCHSILSVFMTANINKRLILVYIEDII